MADRLRAAYLRYPIQEYYGDFGDFTQSKAKEWGDLCGSDFHVCRIADYPHGNLNANPRGLRRRGVTSRLNAFVDRFDELADKARELAQQDPAWALYRWWGRRYAT